MPIETADDLAVFFDADEFGVPAVYTEPGLSPRPIVVLRQQPSQDVPFGQGTVVMSTNAVQILRSDVPVPAEGASLSIGDEAFVIQGAPRLDSGGVIWTCELQPD